jgi:hypothetical protein
VTAPAAVTTPPSALHRQCARQGPICCHYRIRRRRELGIQLPTRGGPVWMLTGGGFGHGWAIGWTLRSASGYPSMRRALLTRATGLAARHARRVDRLVIRLSAAAGRADR